MMNRIQYRTLVKNNNNKGIFQYMNDITSLPWDEYFKASELDALYTNFRGRKLCSSYIMGELETGVAYEDVMKECAMVISSAYMAKWKRLFDVAMVSNPDIKTGSEYYETIEETILDEGNSQRNYTSEVTGKVSAYNSDDFVNDDNETTTDTDTTNNDNNRTRTYTKQGSQNILKNIEYTYNYLKENYIYDIIFKDVDSIMTIGIYYNE